MFMVFILVSVNGNFYRYLAQKAKRDRISEAEGRKNKYRVPAGDDDYDFGVFDVWKSLSPPRNINKQPAAVTNTDKR